MQPGNSGGIKKSSVSQSAKISNTNTSNNNNNNSNNNSGNSSHTKLQAYDQDISKVLLDKISHLLNDNDKLVERQRRKYLRPRDEINEPGSSNELVDEELLQPPPQSTHSRTNILPSHQPITAGGSSYKHDRIKKLCNLALDLQTKMQQTKLKLFGINSSEDEYEPHHHHQQHHNHQNRHLNDQDIDLDEMINATSGGMAHFRANRDKLNSQRQQQQQQREDRTKLRSFEELDSGSNDDFDATKLPGVGNMADFSRSRHELTPDIAARRIQTAYRLYVARKNKRR